MCVSGSNQDAILDSVSYINNTRGIFEHDMIWSYIYIYSYILKHPLLYVCLFSNNNKFTYPLFTQTSSYLCGFFILYPILLYSFYTLLSYILLYMKVK